MGDVIVVTMLQQRDFPEAAWSLTTVDRARDRSPRLLLWNDGPDGIDVARQQFGRELIDAGRNLGVASGRNRLIRMALDMGANWIVAIDDDVLVPVDYLLEAIRLARRLKTEDPHFGVMAPAVLGFPALAKRARLDERVLDRALRSTKHLRNFVADAYGGKLPRKAIDYVGITHWERHYLNAHGSLAADLRAHLVGGTGISVNGNLRADGEHRRRILEGGAPVQVDTVPGGVAIFSRSLLEELGGFEETLGIFGYEDAELCIRARRLGYSLYSAPSLLVLHDIQGRGQMRQLETVYSGRNRHRALALVRHAPFDVGEKLFELFILGIPEMWEAVASREGFSDLETTVRVGIESLSAFASQWHVLHAQGEQVLESPEAPQAWDMNTTVERGVVTTVVELMRSPVGEMESAEIYLCSDGPDHGPSSVRWSLEAKSRAGSMASMGVSIERSAPTDHRWRLVDLHGRWSVENGDAEIWDALRIPISSAVARGGFRLKPDSIGLVSQFRVEHLVQEDG